jgi:hypothetical protein
VRTLSCKCSVSFWLKRFLEYKSGYKSGRGECFHSVSCFLGSNCVSSAALWIVWDYCRQNLYRKSQHPLKSRNAAPTVMPVGQNSGSTCCASVLRPCFRTAVASLIYRTVLGVFQFKVFVWFSFHLKFNRALKTILYFAVIETGVFVQLNVISSHKFQQHLRHNMIVPRSDLIFMVRLVLINIY